VQVQVNPNPNNKVLTITLTLTLTLILILTLIGDFAIGILEDAGHDQIKDMLSRIEPFHRKFEVQVAFKDMGYWVDAAETKIPTVGNALKDMFFGRCKETHRVDILKGISGRILSGKLTLVLGPPGSGKTVFLKALSG
jgi:ABC-type uncharacterized transport system fused permease/ATPase subunit